MIPTFLAFVSAYFPTVARFLIYLLLGAFLAQLFLAPRRQRRNLKVKYNPRPQPGYFSWLATSKDVRPPTRRRTKADAKTSRPAKPVSYSSSLVIPDTPAPPSRPTPVAVSKTHAYEAFLVLDVEGTCDVGTTFSYPNEIIEFPICLLRWEDGELKESAVFKSYVKPTWKPTLSQYCMQLTGITQSQVDAAPIFSVVLDQVFEFLVANGLVDRSGNPLVKFCWATDGPWDIRDFVIKQCFISKIPLPTWLQGHILNVRAAANTWRKGQATYRDPPVLLDKRAPSFNISEQLATLGLPAFEGRQHSGIDDARNISRILAELGRRGARLEPGLIVNPHRRWKWMGDLPGEILAEHAT